MGRGIDHIVHAVRDLDAAAEFYQRLGFTVGARNRHPWGTHNRLVLLAGSYIELLTVAEPERIQSSTATQFSFGGFNRDFLAGVDEGLSMLVLSSGDPRADKASFDPAGFGGFDLFDFSRKGMGADGSEIEVAFELAFARDPASPQAGFFTILHKTPQHIWLAELQCHENGAQAVAAAVFVAESPTDHHIFLEAFSGVRDVHSTSLGISVATARGTIQVMERQGFRDVFGLEPPAGEGMRFAAVVLTVADLETTGALLARNSVAVRRHEGRLVIGGEAARGAVLAFST